MATIPPRPLVEVSQRQRVTYEKREILFGIVYWWIKVRTEIIGDDLIIETARNIENVYLNGVKIK